MHRKLFSYPKSVLIHKTYSHTKAYLINAIDDCIYQCNNESFQQYLNDHTPVKFRCVV